MKSPRKSLASLMMIGILSSPAYPQTTPSQESLPPAPLAPVPALPIEPPNAPSSPTSPGAAIIKPSFQLLDSNHDGWISRSEAASVPDLAKDFDRHDLNRDGKLDRSEFDRYLK